MSSLNEDLPNVFVFKNSYGEFLAPFPQELGLGPEELERKRQEGFAVMDCQEVMHRHPETMVCLVCFADAALAERYRIVSHLPDCWEIVACDTMKLFCATNCAVPYAVIFDDYDDEKGFQYTICTFGVVGSAGN